MVQYYKEKEKLLVLIGSKLTSVDFDLSEGLKLKELIRICKMNTLLGEKSIRNHIDAVMDQIDLKIEGDLIVKKTGENK